MSYELISSMPWLTNVGPGGEGRVLTKAQIQARVIERHQRRIRELKERLLAKSEAEKVADVRRKFGYMRKKPNQKHTLEVDNWIKNTFVSKTAVEKPFARARSEIHKSDSTWWRLRDAQRQFQTYVRSVGKELQQDIAHDRRLS